MDGSFCLLRGKVVLDFQPHEIDEAFFIVQLLSEEERRRGHVVPDFTSSREEMRLEFTSCQLDFAISFISEVLDDIEDDNDSVAKLGIFLEMVKEWHAHHTIH